VRRGRGARARPERQRIPLGRLVKVRPGAAAHAAKYQYQATAARTLGVWPSSKTILARAIRSIRTSPSRASSSADITRGLGNARAFRSAVDERLQPWAALEDRKVAGIRGARLILAAAVANQRLGGFVPIRKRESFRTDCAGPMRSNTAPTRWRLQAKPITKAHRVVLRGRPDRTGGTRKAR